MTVYFGLSNYYGAVTAKEKDGKYYMELDNYDGTDRVEISKELYEMIEKEFGN